MSIPLSRRKALALFALGLGSQACEARALRPGSERPLVIVFGPTHTPQNPRALEKALAAESRLQIALRPTSSSVEAMDLVQSGHADAGLLPLFDYLLCAEVFEVDPVAQLLRHGDQATQRGVLVVPGPSRMKDVQDLTGKRVGYVDPYSVTGFLLAAKVLRDANVTCEAVWLGSHQAVLDAVKDGRVAAGATYEDGAKSPLRELAVTGDIANEPVFVQRSLPAEVRGALARALISVHGAEQLAGLANATGFHAAVDRTYDEARTIVRAAGKSVEDLVPGGWARANEHRRPLWAYAP